MRGSDWLTANLKVMVVRSRIKVSCRRFSDFLKLTANVANAMLLMKNCVVQHHHPLSSSIISLGFFVCFVLFLNFVPYYSRL